MLPAAGATAGGILGGTAGAPAGGIGAVPGAAVGGAMGAASGRALENFGRKAMGLPANVPLTERLGLHLPPGLSEPVDTAEQALMGALGEGGGTLAFGLPGRVAGGIETGLRGVASRQAAKAEAGAARKAAEVAAAREAGPETRAALEQATAAREASSSKARDVISTAAGKPGAPVTSIQKLAERIMQRNPKSYPDKESLVSALYRQLFEASNEVHGVPDRRTRFDLTDLQHLKQTLDAYESTAREAAAAGRGRVSGLISKAADAARSIIEDHVPDVRAINQETKAAIQQEKALRKLAARTPTAEVAAIKSGQQQRSAATLARQALEESAFQPRLSMHGIEVGTPHLARLAGGTANLAAKPLVANTGRYGPDVLNALFRMMQDQSQPDTTGGPQ
jgi:hypothetical protein